ncbi:hypothetical protein DPX16_1010 [Anabarilius grahami]|uniref:Uncharacterized protein n=1 Tax=Anabarilius grahami TaxID=495550 RepID=A0A3N0XS12_ANAGA|nr:hypothetical protein DPX16_1010 [Anabarilius grahami]
MKSHVTLHMKIHAVEKLLDPCGKRTTRVDLEGEDSENMSDPEHTEDTEEQSRIDTALCVETLETHEKIHTGEK